MEKSFKPSEELRSYIENARKKEKNMLERQLIEMSKYNWDYIKMIYDIQKI